MSWLQSFSYECFPTTCWASRLQHQEIISGAPGPITDVSGQINFGVTPIFQRSGDGMLHFFWAGAENPSNPHDLTYYRKKLPDGSWSEIEIFDGKLTHAFVGDQGDVQLLLNSQYVERHIWYTPALGWSLSTTGDGLVLFAWGAQIVAAQEGWQKPTHPLEVISGYKDGFGVYRVFARRFAPPDYHYLYVPDIHH